MVGRTGTQLENDINFVASYLLMPGATVLSTPESVIDITIHWGLPYLGDTSSFLGMESAAPGLVTHMAAAWFAVRRHLSTGRPATSSATK